MTSPSDEIVIATNNPDKLHEITSFLSQVGLTIRGYKEFQQFPDVEESGTTLAENALLKARGVYDAIGLPALADDTGLEIRALDGAPGVYSSRFSGPEASYADNVNKVLALMTGVPDQRRQASFRCVMAFVDDEIQFTVAGVCDGMITRHPRGTGGFGYDPIFYVPVLERTFAEMSEAEKARIGHRGDALRKIRPMILRHLGRSRAESGRDAGAA